jgi:threonine dehydrogenase-like Zn-dependent dehydrogenase
MIDQDESDSTSPKNSVPPCSSTHAMAKRREKAMAMTLGKGVDVAIEAVGVPETFELCQSIIAAGGHIANVGVHGQSVPLHLETLWSREHHHHHAPRGCRDHTAAAQNRDRPAAGAATAHHAPLCPARGA